MADKEENLLAFDEKINRLEQIRDELEAIKLEASIMDCTTEQWIEFEEILLEISELI